MITNGQFLGAMIVVAVPTIILLGTTVNRNKCHLCGKKKYGWQFKHKFNINPYDYEIFDGVCRHCVKTDNTVRKKDNGDFEVFDFANNKTVIITREEVYGLPLRWNLPTPAFHSTDGIIGGYGNSVFNTITQMGGDIETVMGWTDDGKNIKCIYKQKDDDQWMQFSTCSKSGT